MTGFITALIIHYMARFRVFNLIIISTLSYREVV